MIVARLFPACPKSGTFAMAARRSRNDSSKVTTLNLTAPAAWPAILWQTDQVTVVKQHQLIGVKEDSEHPSSSS